MQMTKLNTKWLYTYIFLSEMGKANWTTQQLKNKNKINILTLMIHHHHHHVPKKKE